MIRPTLPIDTPALLQITAQTGMFKPMEVETLREVLDEYHATLPLGSEHHCVTYERSAKPLGFAYAAPAAMTDRSWYLWWIVVSKELQGQGLGTELLRYIEELANRAQGRLMFIETSSLLSYAPTRRFYAKHGYEQHAVIRDLYAEGDDMVLFRKRLGT